jgi:hypothetical protein
MKKTNRAETPSPRQTPRLGALALTGALGGCAFGAILSLTPSSLTPPSLAPLLLRSAHAVPVPAGAFETLLAREVFFGTTAGTRLIGRITESSATQLSDGLFRNFLQRMNWGQMSPLAEEIAFNLRSLEDEFRVFRVAKGRPVELRAGEILSVEEREFLERAAQRLLTGNKLENLLLESRQFVEIARSSRTRTATGTTGASLASGPEVPALPNVDAPDFAVLNQTFLQKIQHRFRLYRNFVRALQMTEGDWRNLFTVSGRPFTVEDWVVIRKYNRLFAVLNEHARMRLVFKAFTQERPVLYAKLNERTASQTADYLEGTLSATDYLSARAQAATELRMNGIVAEAETRMLGAVRRCKELAGGRMDGGDARSLIDIAEDNLRSIQRSSSDLRGRITQTQSTIQRLRGEVRTAPAATRESLRTELRTTERTLARQEADLALWAEREKIEIRELKRMYLQFIESFDSIELFVNLRRGRINSEEVQAFNLPDSFIPAREEIAAWQSFYDRALFNSTNELVLNESRLFFRSAVGETRAFVRQMNELTGKYFGKRFTESALGQEFLEYNRHIAMVVLGRIGRVLGVSLPPGLATLYGDRIWNFVFSLDEPQASSRSDDGTSEPRTPPRASGAPSSATGSGTNGAAASDRDIERGGSRTETPPVRPGSLDLRTGDSGSNGPRREENDSTRPTGVR